MSPESAEPRAALEFLDLFRRPRRDLKSSRQGMLLRKTSAQVPAPFGQHRPGRVATRHASEILNSQLSWGSSNGSNLCAWLRVSASVPEKIRRSPPFDNPVSSSDWCSRLARRHARHIQETCLAEVTLKPWRAISLLSSLCPERSREELCNDRPSPRRSCGLQLRSRARGRGDQ